MKLEPPPEIGPQLAAPKGLTSTRAARLRYVTGMGEAAAAAQAGSGEFDEDEYGAFLDQVDEQFRLVSAASQAFKASIPAAAQQSLAQVGDRFRKDVPKLDAEVKDKKKAVAAARTTATTELARGLPKKAKPQPADIEKHPAVAAAAEQLGDATRRREALVASLKQELRTIFGPWIGKIHKKVAELNAIAPGGDLSRVPTVAELDTAIKAATDMQQSLASIQSLSGQAGKDKQIETLKTAISTTWTKQTGLILRINDAGRTAPVTNAPNPTAELLQRATWLRDWRLKHQAEIAKAASEITGWRRVEQALTDFAFVFVGERTVENPSVQQLLSKGYFGGRTTVTPGAAMNPEQAKKSYAAESKLKASARAELDRERFNTLFFRTMVKYGFDPGVAWSPGSTDPMHFDFAAGLLEVKSGTECEGPSVNP